MKTPEEIYDECERNHPNRKTAGYLYEVAITAMREYARQERDKALEWAAENARIPGVYFRIIKDSILSGKTSKDLEI